MENAFYADSRISEVAVVGIPDERLGELVAAVVSLRHQGLHQSDIEELLIKQVRAK